VPTEDCTDCAADTHNEVYHNSKSAAYKKVSDRPTSVRYGTGDVEGWESTDRVCLDSSQDGLLSKNCLPSHKFLSIYLSNELTDLEADGILGLAPSTQGTTGNKLFIEELYNAGIIGQKMFSMSFGSSPSDVNSKIVFGGYNLDYAKPGEVITWNSLVDELYWALKMTGLGINGTALPLQGTSAVIDSGTSYILVPSSDFETLIGLFSGRNFEGSKKRGCVQDKATGLLKCSCDYDTDVEEEFPTLEISMEGGTYKLPPSVYTVKQWNNCYFKFATVPMADEHNFWILGDAFLHNYMTIFDLETKQIGLIEAVHVEKVDYVTGMTFIFLGVICSIGAVVLGKDFVMEKLESRKRHPSHTVQSFNQVMEPPRGEGMQYTWTDKPPRNAEYEMQNTAGSYRAPLDPPSDSESQKLNSDAEDSTTESTSLA
jgi:hypothetical protein